MNIMKTTALPSAGNDARRELINFFIEGNLLIDLRGLSTLNVLSAFKLDPDIPGI